MSLYNCFTDKIYNNVYFSFAINPEVPKSEQTRVIINAQEPDFRLYALPVKLFEKYTIAIDCDRGIELFCGLYNTHIEMGAKTSDLAARTYQRINKTLFNQPFIYDKLDLAKWPESADFVTDADGKRKALRTDAITRWDIINREKDLKLFIKVPASCKSSITVLEGDFRGFNDKLYAPKNGKLIYKNNHSVLNFNTLNKATGRGDGIDLNNYAFTPISQLQLLALNTGESYPFADRLIEYLSGSVITPIDEIQDNIKRVQKVMNCNNHYFKIDGLWEDKMQNILYDYIMNSGPIVMSDDGKLVDMHQGYHRRLGHTSKSLLFDVLGYADKDVEKYYASWVKKDGKEQVGTSLQSVDIYNGLYDI